MGNENKYEYDAIGRRVSKTVPNGMGSQTVVFVSHESQEVAEYIAGAAAASPERMFIYSEYIDEPSLLIDRTDLGVMPAGQDECFYYHSNNLYSVAALTDSAAAVVERYAYDAYGSVTYLDASGTMVGTQVSTVAQPCTFTGRKRDDETGLQYFRARYFDSATGRFISRDPIAYEGSEWNLYEYVSSNPGGYVDPEGKQFDSVTCYIQKCMKLPTLAERIKCIEAILPDEKAKKLYNSLKDLQKHLDNLKAAINKLKSLKEALKQASGKKKQEALKKEIDSLLNGKKGIKGHIKEVKQKWGEDVLEELGDLIKDVK